MSPDYDGSEQDRNADLVAWVLILIPVVLVLGVVMVVVL